MQGINFLLKTKNLIYEIKVVLGYLTAKGKKRNSLLACVIADSLKNNLTKKLEI